VTEPTLHRFRAFSRRERRERALRRAARRSRGLAALPTMLTLGNLVCGFAAIHYAMKPVGPTEFFGWNTLTVAGLLLFIGMFFDAIDGSVARLTRSTSDLGAQLDSLADVVSFGVAPAFMVLRLVSHYYGPQEQVTILGPEADSIYAKILWSIAAIYVCCTALRLARFNAETTSPAEEDHKNFKGLPSPGAGGTIASLIVLHQHLLATRTGVEENLAFARFAALGIPLIALLCAFAMVSTIRYAHFANRVLRAKRDFSSLVRIVVPLIACIFSFQITLAAAFTLYALSGPVRALWLIARRDRTPIPPASAPPTA
jgi:CDP-diacylglycerol--serine O-phosphatidyltransferase